MMRKILFIVALGAGAHGCAHDCQCPPEIVQEKVVPPSEEMCKPWTDGVKIEKVNCLEELNKMKESSKDKGKK